MHPHPTKLEITHRSQKGTEDLFTEIFLGCFVCNGKFWWIFWNWFGVDTFWSSPRVWRFALEDVSDLFLYWMLLNRSVCCVCGSSDDEEQCDKCRYEWWWWWWWWCWWWWWRWRISRTKRKTSKNGEYCLFNIQVKWWTWICPRIFSLRSFLQRLLPLQELHFHAPIRWAGLETLPKRGWWDGSDSWMSKNTWWEIFGFASPFPL